MPSVDTLHYFSYQLCYFHHCYLFLSPQMDMIFLLPAINQLLSSLLTVLSTIATVDGYAKEAHVGRSVSLEIVCFLSYSKLFHYLISSVHPRHGGGDARKAHVGRSRYCESLEILCLSVDMLHYFSYQLSISSLLPVPSTITTADGYDTFHYFSYKQLLSSLLTVSSTITTVDGYAKKAHVGRSK